MKTAFFQQRVFFSTIAFLLAFTSHSVFANSLNYPTNTPLTARDIAQQVHFVMRAHLPKNAISKKNNGDIARLINRREGRKASVNTFESFINNDYKNGIVQQKQLSIFRSGKLKGTGILITHYIDKKRSPLMQLWLPKLRKVRRFAAPEADEFWNGSNLTYGEVFLRQVDDEEHQLIEQTVFKQCLKTLELPPEEQTKHTQNLPKAQCQHQGKTVYVLKSSTRLKNWWYDHHLSYIDSTSFAPYRTEYFKDQQLVKTVDMDWQSLNLKDPRAVYPAYLYAHSPLDKRESLFIVPRSTVYWDANIKAKFWSESSLRKIKR